MKEEEMLEIISDLLTDPFHCFSKTLTKDIIQIYALAISVLRDIYYKEKSLSNELQLRYEIEHDKYEEKNKQFLQLQSFYENDYIRKNKVKEKIEELEEKEHELSDEQGYWGGSDLQAKIEILNEILEENNEN